MTPPQRLSPIRDVEPLSHPHGARTPLAATVIVIAVWQMMTRETFTLDAGLSIREAAAQLLERKLHGAPIVDGDGVLLGVVSQMDLLGALLTAQSAERQVRDVATAPPLTVRPDDGVFEAAERMVRTGVHRLPVVDAAGCLRGVLTPMDVLRGIVNLEDGFRVRRSPCGRDEDEFPQG